MKCEMCNENMNYNKEGSVQGFRCPVCGNWGVITTFIDEIYMDETIYSLYINKPMYIDVEKIRCIAKTANVNFIMAKQYLEKEKICILKAKAHIIKDSIMELQKAEILYEIFPSFKYLDEDGFLSYDFDKEGEIGKKYNKDILYWK